MLRRSLGARAAQGIGEGLSQVLSALLQGHIIDQRQEKSQAATRTNQALSDFDTSSRALGTPENVSKFGPDVVAAQYQNLKRRLPKSLLPLIGSDPDFKPLDSSPETRSGDILKTIQDATTPEAVPSKPMLTAQMQQRRLPTEETAPSMMIPGSMKMPGGTETFDSEMLQKLSAIAGGKAGALEKSQDDATLGPVEDFSTGTKTTKYLTRNQRAGQSFQGERTAGQEAGRQGAITGATKQAETDVETNPANVKKFASKEAAVAYAREHATQTADKQLGAGSFKRTTQVVEGQPDENGNKTWQVIDTSPDQVGSSGVMAGGEKPTTAEERVAFGYANRGVEEHARLLALEPIIAQQHPVLTYLEFKSPNLIKNAPVRQYAQSLSRFINASLGRPESGGAITEDEFKNYGAMYGFQPGDDAKTLAAKQEARRSAIGGLSIRSGKRLGGVFVTMGELEADAAATGTPIQNVLRQAEQEGLKVIK